MTVVEGFDWDADSFADLTTEGRIAQVARAQAIAVIAHHGQVDKLGEPYILHPTAVADGFHPIDETLEACAAWLHDVIEDTHITSDLLDLAGIHPEVIEVVELLTRQPGDSEEYYWRIAQHPAARAVKIADIGHNTNPDRVEALDAATRERLRLKYDRALAILGEPWPLHEPSMHPGWFMYGSERLWRDEIVPEEDEFNDEDDDLEDELEDDELDDDVDVDQAIADFERAIAESGLDPEPEHLAPVVVLPTGASDTSLTELTPEMIASSWQIAADLVRERPELLATWTQLSSGPAHLVVHLGAHGAALHFDDPTGPMWVRPGAEPQRVQWDAVEGQRVPGLVELDEHWGPVSADAGASGRVDAVRLIADVLGGDVRSLGALRIDGDPAGIVVVPARLIASGAAGDVMAESLVGWFEGLDAAVAWHTSRVGLAYRSHTARGEVAYWHEPLWVVLHHHEPVLVIDENGTTYSPAEGRTP